MPRSAARATKSTSPWRSWAITGPGGELDGLPDQRQRVVVVVVDDHDGESGSSRTMISAASWTETAKGVTSWPRPCEDVTEALQRVAVLVGEQHGEVRLAQRADGGRRGHRNVAHRATTMGHAAAEPPAADRPAPQPPGARSQDAAANDGRGVHRRSIRAGPRAPSISRLGAPSNRPRSHRTAPLAPARTGGCSSATTATATLKPATRWSSASSRSRVSSPAATSAAARRSTTSSRSPRSACSRRSTASTPPARRRSPRSRCRRSSASSSATSATRAGRCASRATSRSWPCASTASARSSRASSAARPRRARSPSAWGSTRRAGARGARGCGRLPRRVARPARATTRRRARASPTRSASRTRASASPRTRRRSSG